MTTRKLLILCILLAVTVLFVDSASLSLSEQKKYEKFLQGEGLYSMGDDVVILKVDNFNKEIFGSSYAWLVEFYNSWCGFCQRFAPSWKALGTDLRGWSDLVKIAAIDCSVDANAPICRDYEIMGYPTLRYFHENYKAGPQNLGIAVAKGDDEIAHRHNLIERLITEQTEHRGAIYPNLLPYHSNLLNLSKSIPPDMYYAFLVIDKPGSFVGVEVTLDLHKTPTLIRYALSNESALVTSLGLSKFPAIISVDKNNNLVRLPTKGGESRQQLKTVITDFLRSKQIAVRDESVKDEIFTGKWRDVEVPDMASLMQERARQSLKERLKKMGDVVFQVDLESALRYSLKHEVATVKHIQGEKLKALRNYLNILRKYFPFGRNGQLFLTELFVQATDSDDLEGSKVANVVTEAELERSQVFSSAPQWLGCRGSAPTYRGYPCGLWKLFHYLTVNAADQNKFNSNADPLEILSVMHGYIKNFFGCQDCSQHFQEMALNHEMRNVTSQDSAVLWLWMAHNKVNKRLAGDTTEDPDYPKYQFPLAEHCAACIKNGSWNFMEVLQYIKNMYSSINVRYLGSDTTVLHAGLEGRSSSSGGVFKSLDISMCFILYVCSFLLLAVLIRIFLKRGYRKKPYVHDLLGKV